MERPRTIHDFGGFPPELYQVSYPAAGAPALASHLAQMLHPVEVELDQEWGLDHGTWSVLKHVFPEADVPVVQLSIDATKPAAFHHELGRRLAPLRDDNVLVIGSGNVVHNLRAYAWRRQVLEPYDWALRFDAAIRGAITRHDDATLIGYEELGEDARLAVPTPEHYLPLLYIMGQRNAGDVVDFPLQGIEGGSISMLSVQVG
jgi:4,5-DOPA dioxygenase extradiol